MRARFPDDPQEQATLQEIGQELGVSRERVRQLRNRALGKLNDDLPIPDDLAQELWEQLSHRDGFVSLGENRKEAELNGIQRLFLRVKTDGLESWLANTCQRMRKVFFRGDFTTEDVAVATEWIESYCGDRIAQWVGNRSSGTVPWKLSAAVSENLVGYGAYVCRKPLTAYRRRTLDLHQILVEQDRPTSLLRLWASIWQSEYDPTVHDVQRSVQDDAFGHLFLDCGDFGIGPLGAPPGNTPTPGEASTDYLRDISTTARHQLLTSPQDQDEDTIAGQLSSILADRGPLPSQELIDEFRIRTNNEYAKSSAGALLVLFGPFTRLAPGVYGLPSHLLSLDPIHHTVPFLRSDHHLYWYTTARSAGEPLNAFPLWTPAMEVEWVRWAEENAAPELFEQLLRVVDAEKWPVSDRLKDRWAPRITAAHDTEVEPTLPPKLDVSAVDLKALIATGYVARSFGSINWVRANRVLGRRLDASTGVACVGLLMLMGVVRPSKQWWVSQAVKEVFPPIFKSIWRLLNEREHITWEEPDGESLQERLADVAATSPVGWLRENLDFEGSKGPVEEEAEYDDLDSLLDLYGSARRRATRVQLFRELGEERYD